MASLQLPRAPYLGPIVLVNPLPKLKEELWSPSLSQDLRNTSEGSFSSFNAVNSRQDQFDIPVMPSYQCRPELDEHQTCSPRPGRRSKARAFKQTAKKGQKRKLEYAELGSARAISLEKNREVAGKCRSKKKQHEEELAEMARETERKNKMLKVEWISCAQM